jgi:hypothetical protein
VSSIRVSAGWCRSIRLDRCTGRWERALVLTATPWSLSVHQSADSAVATDCSPNTPRPASGRHRPPTHRAPASGSGGVSQGSALDVRELLHLIAEQQASLGELQQLVVENVCSPTPDRIQSTSLSPDSRLDEQSRQCAPDFLLPSSTSVSGTATLCHTATRVMASVVIGSGGSTPQAACRAQRRFA